MLLEKVAQEDLDRQEDLTALETKNCKVGLLHELHLSHILQGEVYVEREVEELPHHHASRDESASSRKSRTFDCCIQEDDRKTKKRRMSA